MDDRCDCFAEKVFNYIFWEWEVNILQYPEEIQCKAMNALDEMRGEGNIPNAAAKIAMEVLPL